MHYDWLTSAPSQPNLRVAVCHCSQAVGARFREEPEIQKVTAADVQKTATTYIQPSKFAVVVVGDRKVIEAGIRALKLPQPIRVMTVDEALGP